MRNKKGLTLFFLASLLHLLRCLPLPFRFFLLSQSLGLLLTFIFSDAGRCLFFAELLLLLALDPLSFEPSRLCNCLFFSSPTGGLLLCLTICRETNLFLLLLLFLQPTSRAASTSAFAHNQKEY
jgi:hypothetical protein